MIISADFGSLPLAKAGFVAVRATAKLRIELFIRVNLRMFCKSLAASKTGARHGYLHKKGGAAQQRWSLQLVPVQFNISGE
jgi:hypothetical protein